MKIKETRKIPASTREVVVAIVCDLCGRKTQNDSWAKMPFGVEDVEISYESGERYPEGNFTELVSYDICPDCFKNKLVPWLEKQGAEPEVQDRNW